MKKEENIIKSNLQNNEKELVLAEFNNLIKTKEQFDLLLNHIEDFVWVLDKDIKFTFISPSSENILGYTSDEMLKRSPVDLCHPSSFNLIKNGFKGFIDGTYGAKANRWELAFYHKNNETVWLDTLTRVVLNRDGEIDSVICVSRNITFKRGIEQAHKIEKANLKAQIENTEDSIWSVDKGFKILTLNSNFKKGFELSFGVKLNKGTNIVENLPEPLASEWKERYERTLKGEVFKVTDHFEFKDVPQYAEVSFNPIVLDNNIIGVSCFSRDITNQVLGENALKESENRFKTLVANLPSVAFRCKIDEYWTMKFISKEIENLSGYSPEDFIDNRVIPFANIIYEKDKNMFRGIVLDAVKDHRSYSVEYRIVHKNGSIRWVHERGRGNYNIHDETEGLDGVISDITSRKEAEEMLKESEQKFKSIFENTSSLIAIQDNENIYLVNRAWENITGYSAEEAKQIHPIDLVHPQNREKFLDLSKKRLEGKVVPDNYHYHLIDKEGNEKWLDMSSSVILYEGKKSNLIIASDITERKKSDLQIKKLSAGIINTPSSIIITDIDGKIEYVNPFFCEFTGYSFDEVIGENPRILNSGNNDPQKFKELWNTILAGEVWYGELENKKKDGTIFWESARIAPIFDEEGIVISFVAIKEDITEQKRYQEMIEQSENDLRDLNAKKDKFFSIIAHDLRSPLVGLVGLTDILKDEYKELSEEKIQHYLKYANEASHNVFKLLENLLEWSKSQTGRVEFRPEPIDIKELIQDTFGVANIAAQNKNISLINNAFSDIKLSADKNMVFTILRNLISNAIKYSPNGGQIEVNAKPNNRHMIISVTDSGVGIPLDKQDKLFKIDENYSTKGTEKESGSGLGLIICKEFVEKHGGDIWCKSEEEKGSTFSFSLPVFKRSNS